MFNALILINLYWNYDFSIPWSLKIVDECDYDNISHWLYVINDHWWQQRLAPVTLWNNRGYLFLKYTIFNRYISSGTYQVQWHIVQFRSY